MSLLELDQERERLVVTSEHIGSNLMELQRDPTREMLDLAVLDGVTASRWAAASHSSDQLWTWFTKLTALLEGANRLRGTRRSLSAAQESELRALLTGPSIELADSTVPLHLRRLDDARRTSSRCTPDELIDMMTAAFNELRDVVAATQYAWDQLVPRVAAARARLDEIANEPRGLDSELAPELARLRPRLDELGRRLMADPVAADAAEVDRMEAEINALRDDLDNAVVLRNELDAQLAHADAVLAEVRDATQRAADAHEEVTLKIVHPIVPVPAPMPRDLADGLLRVRALAEHGQWRAARSELDAWTDRSETALQRARDDAARNRAPIDERNELRGRIRAYKEKASAHGLLEDRAVTSAYNAAYDELHTAPTDLERAHELVREYQSAVSGDPSEKRRR
jgi:hypothetical protein